MQIEDIVNRIEILIGFNQPLAEIRERLVEAGVPNDLIYLCWMAAVMRSRRAP
jgi:hypothetical protein